MRKQLTDTKNRLVSWREHVKAVLTDLRGLQDRQAAELQALEAEKNDLTPEAYGRRRLGIRQKATADARTLEAQADQLKASFKDAFSKDLDFAHLARTARLTAKVELPPIAAGTFITEGEKRLADVLTKSVAMSSDMAETAAWQRWAVELSVMQADEFIATLKEASQEGNLALVRLCELTAPRRADKGSDKTDVSVAVIAAKRDVNLPEFQELQAEAKIATDVFRDIDSAVENVVYEQPDERQHIAAATAEARKQAEVDPQLARFLKIAKSQPVKEGAK